MPFSSWMTFCTGVTLACCWKPAAEAIVVVIVFIIVTIIIITTIRHAQSQYNAQAMDHFLKSNEARHLMGVPPSSLLVTRFAFHALVQVHDLEALFSRMRYHALSVQSHSLYYFLYTIEYVYSI